jgi:hypothetical protein
METGLGTRPGVADDAGARPELAEHMIDAAIAQRPPRPRRKECGGVPSRLRQTAALVGVVMELRRQLRSCGDPPRLAKLALAHQQYAVRKLDVSQGQGQRFADAHSSAIEHQEQGAKRHGLERTQRRQALLGGGEEATDFLRGLNIGGLMGRAGREDGG